MTPGVLYRRRYWPAAELARHLLEHRTRYHSGCLLWTGACNDDGYPYVSVGGRMTGAHRVVYEALVGPLARGEPVHHRCGNRRCVLPEHLQAATVATNNLEMLARQGYEARLAAAHEWLEDAVAEALEGLRDALDTMPAHVVEHLNDRAEYLTGRVAVLETALAELDPDHLLLSL